MALGNLSIYYTLKNIKSAYNNNKFKISAPTWSSNFSSKATLYLSSKNTKLYPNKIKNKIVFKVKKGYKLKLLSSEMMKLLGKTKKDVHQDKDQEDVP